MIVVHVLIIFTEQIGIYHSINSIKCFYTNELFYISFNAHAEKCSDFLRKELPRRRLVL